MATCQGGPKFSTSPYAILTVTESSVDTNNNRSTLNWSLDLHKPYAPNSTSRKSWSVTVNGQTFEGKVSTVNGSGVQNIGSGSLNVNHNANGAKTVYFSFWLEFASIVWSGSNLDDLKGSGNIVLTQIQTSHTVRFDANGGSGAPANQIKKYGTALTLSTISPTRTGYVFKWWTTSKNGSGQKYSPGDKYTADADVTLYAQWGVTYTIKYDLNGGSGDAPANQTKISGVDLKLSGKAYVKPITLYYNYNEGTGSPDFKNLSLPIKQWNTKPDGSGDAYPVGGTYTADRSSTLYAIYGSVAIGTLPVPTRFNCSFKAWVTSLTNGKTVTAQTTISATTTIYAIYSYNIILDGNGGHFVDITEKKEVEVQEVQEDGTIVTKKEIIDVPVSSVTLTKTHGQPLTIPGYNMMYDSTSESGGSDQASGNDSDDGKIMAFLGWSMDGKTVYTNPQTGETLGPDGGIFSVDTAITLKALWQEPTYAVTFRDGYRDGDAGIIKVERGIKYGGHATPPPNPTRNGYTFSGWLGNYSVIIQDSTVYASWGYVPIWIYVNSKDNPNLGWVAYVPEEK